MINSSGLCCPLMWLWYVRGFKFVRFSEFVCRRLAFRLTIDKRAVGMGLVEQAGLREGGRGGRRSSDMIGSLLASTDEDSSSKQRPASRPIDAGLVDWSF